MSRVTLRWISLGLLAVALVFLGLMERQARFWVATLRAPPVPVTVAEREEAHGMLPGLEDVSFPSRDGLGLKAWYVPARRCGTVVFVHGGFSNRVFYLNEAARLARQGLGILMYDSRASGDSEGERMTWGDREQSDLEGALDWLGRPGAPAGAISRIGVQAFSVGASTATMVAGRDPRIEALLLLAVWTNLSDELGFKAGRLAADWTRHRFAAAGVNVARVDPMGTIGAFAPRPLLMIAGVDDADTPAAVIRQVYAAAHEPKELWWIPGAHHGDYVAVGGEAYLARVERFFVDNLCRSPRL